MTFSWLGRKMKVILLVYNIAFGFVFATMIGFHFIPNRSISILVANSVAVILILTLCGAYLREGVKFYRMLKTFTQVKPLMAKITVILISSSVSLIVSVLLLTILTLVQVVAFPDSNVVSQIFQVIYRSLEFSVVIVLGYPLRTYGEQDPSETSPSGGKLSGQIIEPEDKSNQETS